MQLNGVDIRIEVGATAFADKTGWSSFRVVASLRTLYGNQSEGIATVGRRIGERLRKAEFKPIRTADTNTMTSSRDIVLVKKIVSSVSLAATESVAVFLTISELVRKVSLSS